jgi:hypothetical protein
MERRYVRLRIAINCEDAFALAREEYVGIHTPGAVLLFSTEFAYFLKHDGFLAQLLAVFVGSNITLVRLNGMDGDIDAVDILPLPNGVGFAQVLYLGCVRIDTGPRAYV